MESWLRPWVHNVQGGPGSRARPRLRGVAPLPAPLSPGGGSALRGPPHPSGSEPGKQTLSLETTHRTVVSMETWPGFTSRHWLSESERCRRAGSSPALLPGRARARRRLHRREQVLGGRGDWTVPRALSTPRPQRLLMRVTHVPIHLPVMAPRLSTWTHWSFIVACGPRHSVSQRESRSEEVKH